MVTIDSSFGPVVAATHEQPALVAIDAMLATPQGAVVLVDLNGERIELPESARGLLRQVVHALASARPVEVIALRKRLTNRQTAHVLNVSPRYVVQLLDEGQLPFSWDASRPWIARDVVLAYKQRRDAERREALDEMARLSQEMGLYDLDAAGQLHWRDEREA